MSERIENLLRRDTCRPQPFIKSANARCLAERAILHEDRSVCLCRQKRDPPRRVPRRSGFYRGDVSEPTKDGWLRFPTRSLDAAFGMAQGNIISLLHIGEGVEPVI